MPLKQKTSNILCTKDIEGAVPAKFKHGTKRLLKHENYNSHLSFDSKLIGDDGRKFKPSIRIYNPYANNSFEKAQKDTIMPDINRSRGLYQNTPNLGIRVSHSRNLSVEPKRRNYDRINLSYDSLQGILGGVKNSRINLDTPSTDVLTSITKRRASSPSSFYT